MVCFISGAVETLECYDYPARGRYLKIQNTPGRLLVLCEVQVLVEA
jgi:hypothetical protein